MQKKRSSSDEKRGLKIFAAMGPGDLIHSFEMWRAGERVSSETSITYSSQFFDACVELNARAWSVSSSSKTGTLNTDRFRIENRPKWWRGRGGILFHLSQLQYALSLFISVIRFRPSLVLIDSGTTHYWLLCIFVLSGARVAVDLHNSIWPVCRPPNGLKEKLINYLDAIFFRWFLTAGMGVSPECERQAKLLGGDRLPFFQYRAQYEADDFSSLPPPAFQETPLRIVFVGRMERNKGVMDVVLIARLLKKRGVRVIFELCGDGSLLTEVREHIASLDLGDTVLLHGYLNRIDLIQVYRRSHAAIIPTRADFAEGLPKAAAEAVLSGRPIISTEADPALKVLGPACLVANVNDPSSFADVIEAAFLDREGLENLATTCKTLSAQFVDRRRGYTAALKTLIASVHVGE
jgi:glycosyltransferase involved in cell wall biosynthesis